MEKNKGNGTKGRVVKVVTANGTFYYVLGADWTQMTDDQISCSLVYCLEAPVDWLLCRQYLFDPHTLQALTQEDRIKLLPACFACPVEIMDPILMSMMNEQRLQDVVKTLFDMQRAVQALGDGLSPEYANELVQHLKEYEGSLFNNPTIVQQLLELYWEMQTPVALAHIVELSDAGVVVSGAAATNIVNNAKRILLMTRNDPA